MNETLISIPGRGYELSVKIVVEGDYAKVIADADKIRDGIAKAFDQAIRQDNEQSSAANN
jgi:hypothetical protein